MGGPDLESGRIGETLESRQTRAVPGDEAEARGRDPAEQDRSMVEKLNAPAHFTTTFAGDG